MFRFAFVFVLAALAGACATLPEPTLSVQAGGFALNGRVAVRYGTDAVSGQIFWRHTNDGDELLITSALGQGVARLVRSGGNVQLTTKDGRQYHAADAESLTEDVLGWRLPLNGLPDWVLGRAGTGGPAELDRDSSGRLRELRQNDWKIEYQAYEGDRPSRLRLSREDIEIRLVIDRWDA